MDLQGYRYWIYGISDSQRVGKLIRFLCVFRYSGNKITQRARAQWVEKENRVLLGWYSINGFTGFGGSSTGPVWFLCRDCSSWRGSSLSTEVYGWAILEVSDNPQKVSPPGYSWENKGTLLWLPKRSWVPKMLELWPAGPFAACVL